MSNQLQTTLDKILQEKNENLLPENLRRGISLLGVDGTLPGDIGDDTSDATVQAKYLLEGYFAVVDGHLIEGTMSERGSRTIIANEQDVEIPEGHYTSLSIPIVNAANCKDYAECLNAINSI